MANKITYSNKVGLIAKTVHENQFWDDDANEIKSKHNLNDDRVTNLEDNQTVGYLAYSTYADLPTTGTLNYSYKVTNDPDTALNGYYHYSGSAYVKDAELNQDIVDDVTELQGEVFGIVELDENVSFSAGGGVARNDYYDIPDGYTLKFDLTTLSGLPSYQVRFYSDNVLIDHLGSYNEAKQSVEYTNNTGQAFDEMRLQFLSGTSVDGVLHYVVSSPLSVDNRLDAVEEGVAENENNITENENDILINAGAIIEIKGEGYSNEIIKGNNAKINDLAKSIIDNGDYYEVYNGVDSYQTLNDSYTLENEGDYLEWRFQVNDFVLGQYGVFGEKTSTQYHSVGSYGTSGIRVRTSNSTFKAWTGLSYSSASVLKLEVVNGGDGLELFIDGISQGSKTFTGETLIIKDIANAYTGNFSDVDIYYFKVSTSEGEISTLPMPFTIDSNNVILTPITAANTDYKACYVSYDATGSGGIGIGESGYARIVVYTQSPANESKYVAVVIDRYFVESTNLRRSDYYRIVDCYECTFNGTTMTSTGIQLFEVGESEFVYGRSGRYDFSGGIHGNEYTTEVNFFIDGVIVSDLSTLTGLTACDEFRYIVKSEIHTPPDSGGTPEPSYPVESTHIKDTVIRDGGYETYNEVTGVIEISDFSAIYINLFSVSSDIADYAQLIGQYTPTEMLNDGVDKLTSEVYRDMMYWDESNEISVRVESECKQYDEGIRVRIKDSDTQPYCKFYKDVYHSTDWDGVLGIGEQIRGTGLIVFNLR